MGNQVDSYSRAVLFVIRSCRVRYVLFDMEIQIIISERGKELAFLDNFKYCFVRDRNLIKLNINSLL